MIIRAAGLYVDGANTGSICHDVCGYVCGCVDVYVRKTLIGMT